ncbi:MAG: hypothetical protein NTY47_08290, partial [Candidatus Omnitrophica bacterium]|nr:hypothetical protein [Candidatus Omnitrophota bacterium]
MEYRYLTKRLARAPPAGVIYERIAQNKLYIYFSSLETAARFETAAKDVFRPAYQENAITEALLRLCKHALDELSLIESGASWADAHSQVLEEDKEFSRLIDHMLGSVKSDRLNFTSRVYHFMMSDDPIDKAPKASWAVSFRRIRHMGSSGITFRPFSEKGPGMMVYLAEFRDNKEFGDASRLVEFEIRVSQICREQGVVLLETRAIGLKASKGNDIQLPARSAGLWEKYLYRRVLTLVSFDKATGEILNTRSLSELEYWFAVARYGFDAERCRRHNLEVGTATTCYLGSVDKQGLIICISENPRIPQGTKILFRPLMMRRETGDKDSALVSRLRLVLECEIPALYHADGFVCVDATKEYMVFFDESRGVVNVLPKKIRQELFYESVESAPLEFPKISLAAQAKGGGRNEVVYSDKLFDIIYDTAQDEFRLRQTGFLIMDSLWFEDLKYTVKVHHSVFKNIKTKQYVTSCQIADFLAELNDAEVPYYSPYYDVRWLECAFPELLPEEANFDEFDMQVKLGKVTPPQDVVSRVSVRWNKGKVSSKRVRLVQARDAAYVTSARIPGNNFARIRPICFIGSKKIVVFEVRNFLDKATWAELSEQDRIGLSPENGFNDTALRVTVSFADPESWKVLGVEEVVDSSSTKIAQRNRMLYADPYYRDEIVKYFADNSQVTLAAAAVYLNEKYGPSGLQVIGEGTEYTLFQPENLINFCNRNDISRDNSIIVTQ